MALPWKCREWSPGEVLSRLRKKGRDDRRLIDEPSFKP